MLYNNNNELTIFNAGLGLSLLLAVLVSCFTIFTPQTQYNQEHILTFVFHVFVHWKALTLVSFLFGIYLAHITQFPEKVQLYHQKVSIVLVVTIILSFFVSQVLFIIAFVVTGATVLSLKSLNAKAILLVAFVFYTVGALFSIPEINSELQLPEMIKLINQGNGGPSLGKAINLITRPEELANIFYGFALILVGYLIGKHNWLEEYPFRYRQLKFGALIAFLGILLWFVLLLTGIYNALIETKIGQLFFMMDALFINACVVFLYLYLLVSLENYTFGKKIIKHLSNVGRIAITFYILFFISQLLLNQYQRQQPILVLVIPLLIIFMLGIIARFYFKKFSADPVVLIIEKLVHKPKT
jgi:uncharacterized membrane protein YeiB